MTRSTLLKVLFVALLGVALPRSAFADDGGAEPFVKDKHAELTELLKKPKSPANDKKVQAVFDELLDYDYLARESLKDYWGERSDAEKKDFSDVLQQLVRNAYRKNLKKTLEYSIEYRGSDKAKQGYLVRTVAKSKTNSREDPISVDYLLHKVNGKWRVYDIVTEGSSLVHNYRSQFRRIIKKKGFDELMRRMKDKLAKAGTP